MSHRKQRENKQHPSMLSGPAVPGCCLVSFCFLCDIHSIHSVDENFHPEEDGSAAIKAVGRDRGALETFIEYGGWLDMPH